MIRKLLFAFGLFAFSFVNSNAQSIQLYSENFESATPSFILNTAGVGLGIGSNRWIVNNTYDGIGLYPNTMPQDSTFGGTIDFPNSKYMHIRNSSSAALNTNYNPATQSDNFTYMQPAINVCTYGYNSIVFSFFYLCEGSPTAYAEVYYSKDGGPWTQVGAPQYNAQYKWKYVTVSDPDFVGVGNLRFGFRWINDSGTSATSISFGVDDIRVVGFYDLINPAVNINVNLLTDSVCQGTSILANIQFSDSLCNGNYLLELSTATGSFPNPLFPPLVYVIPFPLTNFFINVGLPPSILPGSCYKIRFSRFSPPPPPINGTASVCFAIIACPNTITTIQPTVTRDTNAVCVGSVIDVPFFSTGVFTNNLYSAELSDVNGVFPSTPPLTILGTFPSDQNFPGPPPGSVPGKIPNVPDGCNYYVRVRGSNPLTIGIPWGPFCIQHCDIQTNNGQDIKVCLMPTTVGWDTLVNVNINYWDSVPTYLSLPAPGNKFTIELRCFNPLPGPPPCASWAFINVDSLGFTYAVTDTTINLVIPPLAQLMAMGINPGVYYMRVIATNAAFPDSSLGTVVRLTIGAPDDTPPSFIMYNQSQAVWNPDTICVNNVVNFFLQIPHAHQSSTYVWLINGTQTFKVPGSQGGNLSLIFTGPGLYSIQVTEESFGCLGVSSTIQQIYAKGGPNTTFTGPAAACVGDTITLYAPNAGVPGFWRTSPLADSTHAQNIYEGDDIWSLYFDSAKTYTVIFEAQNECDFASSSRQIRVYNPPLVDLQPSDTVVCLGESVLLYSQSTNTPVVYSFAWTESGDTLKNSSSWKDSTFLVTPDSSTYYVVTVRVSNNKVCPRTDSMHVEVRGMTTENYEGKICPDGTDTLTLNGNYAPATFTWSTGETTDQITISTVGSFWVDITTDTSVCKRRMVYTIGPDNCPVPPDDTVALTFPNVFTPDGSGLNDFFTPLISGPFDQFEVTIYNRWGKIIYGPVSDPFFKWDGFDNNKKEVSAGVYYWIVNASYKGTAYPGQKGFVTLVRAEK